jgi:hypothetical protein
VWHEPAAPVVAPASAKEQAAQAEAHCRLAVYVAQENMSRKEANAFSERVANMMETMQKLYSTEGSLRNVALDHLGVMRYPECKEAEDRPLSQRGLLCLSINLAEWCVLSSSALGRF